jgi:tRNA uridine 5-carboxymethylaminomethyl modification enzyme
VQSRFDVIVIGGGHAGAEAAWAAANILARPRSVALVTMDPSKVGVMSCNPAIGGLAKGQLVREIDALNGLMALATDATGIQFKVLNTSKGPAVHGPRAQCDKHAYARAVQSLIAQREEIVVIAGTVDDLIVEQGTIRSVVIAPSPKPPTTGSPLSDLALWPFDHLTISAPAVVLTTGTFMRALMHTGPAQTPGGRFGEGSAVGISASLKSLGFELGRLKTGTPPRLKRSTIDWNNLEPQLGDDPPVPFSDLSVHHAQCFPALPQVDCRITTTTSAIHELIRANLHRAPMYSGQIESTGPRYCPSIEDKVVRFAERHEHHVYLEPESLEDDWIYCNGISTSLPADVQTQIVRAMPGCERAEILRFGYAVEYDMVRPHQLCATGETKLIRGLFLAGQINGTSGYEEAAAQGLLAGINAARTALKCEHVTLGRDQAYIGVLMDDLVTKTPVEPYRMFTSRAEHRLLLRADNSADRLTPLAQQWGMLETNPWGHQRAALFAQRTRERNELNARIDATHHDSRPLADVLRRPEFTAEQLLAVLGASAHDYEARTLFTVMTDRFYSAYIEKERSIIERSRDNERKRIPDSFDFASQPTLRTEARNALARFRPQTLGQAARLEGMTPADVTLLSVLVQRHRASIR